MQARDRRRTASCNQRKDSFPHNARELEGEDEPVSGNLAGLCVRCDTRCDRRPIALTGAWGVPINLPGREGDSHFGGRVIFYG